MALKVKFFWQIMALKVWVRRIGLLQGWVRNLLLVSASRISWWLPLSQDKGRPPRRQRSNRKRRRRRSPPMPICTSLITEEYERLKYLWSRYAIKEPDASSLAVMAELWRRAIGQSESPHQHSKKDALSGSETDAAGLECLPPHLQRVILGMLPLHKILQFRSVCRSWNAVLQSSEFLHHTGLLQQAESWFILARVGDESEGLLGGAPLVKKLVAYSPSLGRYFPIPGLHHPQVVASLGVGAIRVAFDVTEGCGYKHPVAMRYTLCGAGGLLCCMVYGVQPQNYICLPLDSRPEIASVLLFNRLQYLVVIFNPLTGAIHTLPPPPMLDYSNEAFGKGRISMHVHSGNHYYVALFTAQYLQMVVYDSRTGLWKAASETADAGCDTLQSLIEGDLFCFCLNGVAFYNLERDLWCKKKLLWDSLSYPCVGADSYIVDATVLRCEGCVVLAAPLVKRPDRVHVLGFAIWKLDTCGEEVKAILLSCTPTELWKPVHNPMCPNHFHCSFTTNGTLVCMTGSDHMVPLLYDLAGDKWSQLPSYKGTFEYVSLSSFQPRLDMAPLPSSAQRL